VAAGRALDTLASFVDLPAPKKLEKNDDFAGGGAAAGVVAGIPGFAAGAAGDIVGMVGAVIKGGALGGALPVSRGLPKENVGGADTLGPADILLNSDADVDVDVVGAGIAVLETVADLPSIWMPALPLTISA